MTLTSIGTPTLWIGFLILVLIVLAIDLWGLGGKKNQQVSQKEALTWTAIWIALAFAFGGALWWYLLQQGHAPELAKEKTLEFFTGYLIEKSLSVDNIFVFLMVFSFFSVPPQYQRRVLLYGVLGAIIMRAIMIFAGAALVTQFHWLMYVFGGFLLLTGLKMLLMADKESDLNNNPLFKWLRGHLRITDEFHDEKFVVVKDGVRWFTPLFLVVVMIELTDLIFAVDSIPAIFAITTDPFIVFTSNIFAIMGLRALYFLLADWNERFHLLKYGLAIVLMFVGIKMLLLDLYKIPTGISLGVVGAIIASSMIISWMHTGKQHKHENH